MNHLPRETTTQRNLVSGGEETKPEATKKHVPKHVNRHERRKALAGARHGHK